ncbi:hypothetical protein KP509_16G069300, partial [Ceratopteris richardii]
MLNCKDLWGYIGGHTLRFTYHSRSHKKEMRRTDRCYYSKVSTLNAASKMWIDATMLLSDHNPSQVSLNEVDWNSCIPFNLPRIPLRVNHSSMQTSLFKSKVQSLIQHVLSLRVSACMKWEFLVAKLQDVIRECGIAFSRILNAPKHEAQQLISFMAERVDSRLLSQGEYAQFCKAYKCLELIENQAIKSSKVRAKCTQVNDLRANSECFFDFLGFKHLKDKISHLEVDGSIINDGNAIAPICSEHFQNLFAASYKSDDAWFEALHASLAYTPQLLDSEIAALCEKAISEEEVYMTLQSLKNGKAPGLDGITKEFVKRGSSLAEHLPTGTQKIAVGFADDTFIFAKADEANIQNILTSLIPFSEASALRINMTKSTLINISACHFESLPWSGPKIDKGAVFRHLGYPMGVNISSKDKLD